MLSVDACVAGSALGRNSKAVRCCLAQQQGPDLGLLSPRLRQEWDSEKNQQLDKVQIRPHSDTLCAWSCPEGTADEPHSWDAQVAQQTSGSRCPYCAKAKASRHNTLAPDVATPGATKRRRALHRTTPLKAITRRFEIALSAATSGKQKFHIECQGAQGALPASLDAGRMAQGVNTLLLQSVIMPC